MSGSTVSWMFEDAGRDVMGRLCLASMNPLRWSAARSLPEAVAELKAQENRPVNVKFGDTHDITFKNLSDAIACLQEKTQREEALIEDIQDRQAAKAGAQADASALYRATRDPNAMSGSTVSWMFEDAGRGVMGRLCLASMNPLRWSAALSLQEAVAELKAEENRPVKIKFGATHDITFKNLSDAIACLQEKTQREEALIEDIQDRQMAKAGAEAAAVVLDDSMHDAATAQSPDKAYLRQDEAECVANENRSENIQDRQAAKAGARGVASALDKAVCHPHATSGSTVSWMFEDAGRGVMGSLCRASMNPLRWSAALSLPEAIVELMAAHASRDRHRPVNIKFGDTHDIVFKNASDAIAYLKEKTQREETLIEDIQDRQMAKAEAEAAAIVLDHSMHDAATAQSPDKAYLRQDMSGVWSLKIS